MSCENSSAIYCGEPIMNSSIEHFWSCDQNHHGPSYQISSDVGPAEIDYKYGNQQTWCPDFPNLRSEQNVVTAVNHFHGGYFPQQNAPQYLPLTPEPAVFPEFNLPKVHPNSNNNVMAKRHRAQITLVPTKSGNFKAIVKRKRQRTVFTTEQVEALEKIFKRKQYITREDRQVIVEQLQLNDKAVKIWFQNRRLKDKKGPETIEERNEDIPSPTYETRSPEIRTPDISRLDYVESQINKKTDEFGYVTLDDVVMKDLFNVIDDFLTQTKSVVPIEELTDSEYSPIYEPISPASASDSNDEDNTSKWKPSEPNESLQRLFDLQSLISL